MSRFDVAAGSSRHMTYSSLAGETAQAQSANDPAAMTLLKRVVDAKGGLDALKKVTSVVAEADTAFQMEQGTLPSTTRTYVAYPDKFRVDAKIKGVDVVQVYNAGAAWVRDPAGVHDVARSNAGGFQQQRPPRHDPDARGGLRGEVRRPPAGRRGPGWTRLARPRDQRRTAAAGAALHRRAGTHRPPGVLDTGGADGRPVQVEEVFSDYRKVDGVAVPYKAELVRDGRTILTRTLRSVEMNTPIDAALFSRPEN